MILWMRNKWIHALCVLTALCSVTPAVFAAPPDAPAKRSPVLAALQAEMERSFKALKAQAPPLWIYLQARVAPRRRSGRPLGASKARSGEVAEWLKAAVC